MSACKWIKMMNAKNVPTKRGDEKMLFASLSAAYLVERKTDLDTVCMAVVYEQRILHWSQFQSRANIHFVCEENTAAASIHPLSLSLSHTLFSYSRLESSAVVVDVRFFSAHFFLLFNQTQDHTRNFMCFFLLHSFIRMTKWYTVPVDLRYYYYCYYCPSRYDVWQSDDVLFAVAAAVIVVRCRFALICFECSGNGSGGGIYFQFCFFRFHLLIQ